MTTLYLVYTSEGQRAERTADRLWAAVLKETGEPIHPKGFYTLKDAETFLLGWTMAKMQSWAWPAPDAELEKLAKDYIASQYHIELRPHVRGQIT